MVENAGKTLITANMLKQALGQAKKQEEEYTMDAVAYYPSIIRWYEEGQTLPDRALERLAKNLNKLIGVP